MFSNLSDHYDLVILKFIRYAENKLDIYCFSTIVYPLRGNFHARDTVLQKFYHSAEIFMQETLYCRIFISQLKFPLSGSVSQTFSYSAEISSKRSSIAERLSFI